MKRFQPLRVYGCEPSSSVFEDVVKKMAGSDIITRKHIVLEERGLRSWAHDGSIKRRFAECSAALLSRRKRGRSQRAREGCDCHQSFSGVFVSPQ